MNLRGEEGEWEQEDLARVQSSASGSDWSHVGLRSVPSSLSSLCARHAIFLPAEAVELSSASAGDLED